jgi:hypothetical protein
MKNLGHSYLLQRLSVRRAVTNGRKKFDEIASEDRNVRIQWLNLVFSNLLQQMDSTDVKQAESLERFITDDICVRKFIERIDYPRIICNDKAFENQDLLTLSSDSEAVDQIAEHSELGAQFSTEMRVRCLSS